jgi:hypothetical protein
VRRFEFHPEARAEYLASIAYYDHENIGLGAEFAQEVEDAIELILSFPSAWPTLGGDVRRCMLGRFPYGLIYSTLDDYVLIIAVAHAKRAPGFWQSRQK